jgi:hypothetical protein
VPRWLKGMPQKGSSSSSSGSIGIAETADYDTCVATHPAVARARSRTPDPLETDRKTAAVELCGREWPWEGSALDPVTSGRRLKAHARARCGAQRSQLPILGCWPSRSVILNSREINLNSWLLWLIRRPTSPSSGQATTCHLLRLPKASACHSGAALGPFRASSYAR